MKKTISILGLVAALACAQASAQTAPVLTFTTSTATGAGTVTPTLTWSTTPAATSCAASGHASWTGTKPASGTATLPAITLSGTYTLTMTCSWPGVTSATVTWNSPTLNTDGSALAKCANADVVDSPCLAYFQVFRRVGTTDMNGAEMTEVRNPNATSFTANNLVVGTHNFGVIAVNGNGTPSAMSNIAPKVISGTASANRSVTITVNPKPGPPTLLGVE